MFRVPVFLLSDVAREDFSECFYCRDDAPEDQDSPLPWGAPWLWDDTTVLEGNDMQEMADNFFNKHKDVLKEIKEEQEEEEEHIRLEDIS